MKKFKFHHDSGHGWLAVKIVYLKQLGIHDKISQYSYKRGKTAYLEEDCDAMIFIDAYKSYFNSNPEFITLKFQNRSGIRNYERYSENG